MDVPDTNNICSPTSTGGTTIWGTLAKRIGLCDAEGLKLKDKEGKPLYSAIAEVNYYNGNIGGFLANYKGCKLKNLDWEMPVGKQLKDEKKDIDLFTKSSLSYSHTTNDERIKPDVPKYTDLNGDNRRQDWEPLNLDPSGNPIYVKGASTNVRSTEDRVSLNVIHPRFPGGILNWGLNVSRLNYNGTRDANFTFNPWIDQFTPDYLKRLDGKEYKLLELGPVYAQNIYANYSFSTFSAWPDAPKYISWLSPILVNKINVGVSYTRTSANLTAHKYAYNDTLRDLSDKTTDANFSSNRIDIPVSVESRTFPLFTWPKQIYLSLACGMKLSYLMRNMSDMYYPIDANNELPTSWRGIAYDTADMSVMSADYSEYLGKRKNSKTLNAMSSWFSARVSMPSIVELLNSIHLVKSGYAPGSDKKLNIALKWTKSKDAITNTNNGLLPSTRSAFPTYSKIAGQPAQRMGNIYYEETAPQETTSFDYSSNYMPRISDLGKIKLLGSLFRYTIGWLDRGREKDTPVFLPIEFNGGRQTTKDPVTGQAARGKYGSFGIGLRFNDDFELKYIHSSSDNGYNYSNKTDSGAAIVRF